MGKLEDVEVSPGGHMQMRDNGQVYELTGWIGYVRKDGGRVRLGCWVSQCVDCGRLFSTFLTDGGRFAPNRRCQRCARPGKRVRRRKA
ncbi:hypothetical protein FHT76_006274 [Rhizobium sp. BK176]|nr:hypothetical protein [Rhizobium sp. BK661]MCS4094568.1 hypothetical protein [Rhizobium sp. BK176]